MACRGICDRYRSESQRYNQGIKRCTSCETYLEYDGVQCPCCRTKLRGKEKVNDVDSSSYRLEPFMYNKKFQQNILKTKIKQIPSHSGTQKRTTTANSHQFESTLN